ncbi:MAG TPA: hypothetical protein VH575_16030 [Gemmataceae bacterium]|jgi:predicted small lipoprotein YifL
MRSLSMLLAIIVLSVLAGCGDKSGSGDPANVTADEERQLQEEQKKVDAEERQQMTKRPKALTPEQQVEMQERRQRGR